MTKEEKEDLDLWIAQRRKNWPGRKRLEEKEKNQQELKELGVVDDAKLSKIEMKLRKKLTIIQRQMGAESRPQKKRLGKRDQQEKWPGEKVTANTASHSGQEGKPEASKQKPPQGPKEKPLKPGFKYKKNLILEELEAKEREKEHGIILQAFRFLVQNNIV